MIEKIIDYSARNRVIILMLFALLVGLFLLWYARLLLRERKANKRKSRSKAAARKPKTDKEDRQ